MRIEEIDLSEIDLSNDRYLIPFKTVPAELTNSIKDVGVINPPILISQGKELFILTGFKRIRICRDLNLRTLQCRVIEEGGLDPGHFIKLIFEDNKHRFTDVDIGQLFTKFLNGKYTVKNLLEQIDYPTTEKNIERFTSLSQVCEQIYELYLDDKLSPEQCLLLSQMSENEALLLTNTLIVPFRFNTNETRGLLNDLYDISVRDNISISDILKSVLDGCEKANKNSIRYEIRNLRSPAFIKVEEQFKELVKKLKLPNDVSLNHSPFFENNFVEFKTKINSEKSLSELKRLFSNEEDFKVLSSLLRLVKEGPK